MIHVIDDYYLDADQSQYILFKEKKCINKKTGDQEIIRAYEKTKKFGWHDLTINPYDLPNDKRLVWVIAKHSYSDVDGYRDAGIGFFELNTQRWFAKLHSEKYYKIIAWKEIEPFEEV